MSWNAENEIRPGRPHGFSDVRHRPPRGVPAQDLGSGAARSRKRQVEALLHERAREHRRLTRRIEKRRLLGGVADDEVDTGRRSSLDGFERRRRLNVAAVIRSERADHERERIRGQSVVHQQLRDSRHSRDLHGKQIGGGDCAPGRLRPPALFPIARATPGPRARRRRPGSAASCRRSARSRGGTARAPGGEQLTDAEAAGRLARDRHLRRITAERGNVLLHPFERGDLVEEAEAARAPACRRC